MFLFTHPEIRVNSQSMNAYQMSYHKHALTQVLIARSAVCSFINGPTGGFCSPGSMRVGTLSPIILAPQLKTYNKKK